MTALLGLDLSCTASAAVAVPLGWDGDWRRVATLLVGEKLHRDATDAARAMRAESIATRLVAFAVQQGAGVAYVESYGYSHHTAAHSPAELGGVVRLALVRAGLDLRTSNMGAARKLLLGKVPRANVKVAVHSALRAAGAPFESLDVADAFVAANFGLSEAGGFCFAQAAA